MDLSKPLLLLSKPYKKKIEPELSEVSISGTEIQNICVNEWLWIYLDSECDHKISKNL